MYPDCVVQLEWIGSQVVELALAAPVLGVEVAIRSNPAIEEGRTLGVRGGEGVVVALEVKRAAEPVAPVVGEGNQRDTVLLPTRRGVREIQDRRSQVGIRDRLAPMDAARQTRPADLERHPDRGLVDSDLALLD